MEAGKGDKTALIFEADDGTVNKVSYAELLARTAQLANALKARGDEFVVPALVPGLLRLRHGQPVGAVHAEQTELELVGAVHPVRGACHGGAHLPPFASAPVKSPRRREASFRLVLVKSAPRALASSRRASLMSKPMT